MSGMTGLVFTLGEDAASASPSSEAPTPSSEVVPPSCKASPLVRWYVEYPDSCACC